MKLAGGSGGDADFGDHATARAVEAALSATLHALPPALEPPRRGRELWELLRRRWCELTAPYHKLTAPWHELAIAVIAGSSRTYSPTRVPLFN